MHIRPATPSDFPSAASISVLCFWNDELYDYTNPWREQHPDHFRSLFLRRHKIRFVTPGYVFHVAVTDEGDQNHKGEGKVVAFAVWERTGTSKVAMVWRKDTFWKLLERTLLTAQEYYLSLLRADKSLHYARLAHFLAEAKSDFASIPEMWKMQNLAVHPNFQRRGIASMLLNWGKQQAGKEGVPIGLEASELARPLYLKNGFRKFGNMHIEDFPIEDVPIFLWEPRGLEGMWGMKGDVGE
ncbi:hypothetical protein HO133_004921 [Letharia lupina]|uniref:N-acetyltransferase domain-containing protein n=1 Tax=Letharia lupina TaxID=560253 RepID=A0A8H6F8P2_9LECA|nr:uncharacterized protein HO133_004921 [Letharia lupina]KAF6219096.1 hypothetical protein HO133_004921 [Letharia lupina]